MIHVSYISGDWMQALAKRTTVVPVVLLSAATAVSAVLAVGPVGHAA